MKQTEFTSKLREARLFALSLLSEGYIFVLEWVDERTNSAFIKLRHRTNGNTIKITAQRDKWQANKNGKIIKLVH